MNGYFDHNATTPLFPQAAEAQCEAAERHWHNPSSLYREAGETRRLLESKREDLADLLGIDEPARIVFTSGATESNNVVLRGFHPEQSALSAIEHPSVMAPGEGASLIPVTDTGVVDLEALIDIQTRMDIRLVSIMAANNETGVIQPIAEIRAATRCHLHCDAAQAFGKLAPDQFSGCDWITGSSHKFGGPKGVGFLVVPEDTDRLPGAATGGPQERGLRAGTENYPAIAGMMAALEMAESLRANSAALAQDRDTFETRLKAVIPGTKVCGENAPRLWNTSMIVAPSHGNLKWLTRLSRRDFQVSTGSACSSGKDNPSHVMQAMGLNYDEMGRVLRLSGGWTTTEEDWVALGDALMEVWKELESGGKPKRPRQRTLDKPTLRL